MFWFVGPPTEKSVEASGCRYGGKAAALARLSPKSLVAYEKATNKPKV